MNKREEYINFINQYFEDVKKKPPIRGEDWSVEEKFAERVMSIGTKDEYLKELKQIILKKNDEPFAIRMLYIAQTTLECNTFLFETELLLETCNEEIKKRLIKGLRHYFICDNESEFEQLNIDEQKEYLKKLDLVQGVPNKMKELKKIVKERIGKFGNI